MAPHFSPQYILESKNWRHMKNNNLIVLAVLILFFGCLPEDEFNLPLNNSPVLEVEVNSNIKAVINALKQSEEGIYTFGENEEAVMEGFVISSDEAGNFYKTMIIQDKSEDPENGIAILIDMRAYYTKYNFGRKIYIKLSGLSIKEEKGQFLLGYLIGNEVVHIPNTLIDNFIFRSQSTEEIRPRKISLEELSHKMFNTYIQVSELQFPRDAEGKTFAGEHFDRYNGERILEQCDNLVRSYLFTSTFADFKSWLLPSGKFSIRAVLSKDYYTDKIIFILNHPGFLIADDSERCDPDFYSCGNQNDPGNRIIYYEDFETFQSTSDIEKQGWTNVNVNFGNGKFKKRSLNENSFLQISAYNSQETVMDVWLVSPGIDLDQSEDEQLTFKTRSTFEEGRILTVWISSDFEEKVENATWQLLNVRISDGTRDKSNLEFTESGAIDLGCLDGEINIGFRYLGSDPGVSTTYDLDHILILGN
jgi:hypothetical protein